MDTEPLTERQHIQRKIVRLRNSIDVYLAYGNAEEANAVRDRISRLEIQLDTLDQRGQETRNKSKGE